MGVNLLNGRIGSRIGTSMTYDIRSRLFSHLQKLSVGFYDRQQVGSLVARVAFDTEAIHGFVNQLTSGFLLQLLMLFGVGVMIFTIDPKLAFVTLIPAPFVFTGTLFFWRYIYPRNYKHWDASSKQAGLLSGILSGIRVVKAFNQEKRETERFELASRRIRDARRGLDVANATFNPFMGIVFMLGGWIVWFVGGKDVISGKMTLGELMAFFGYLWMFYGPLGTLPLFTNWLTTFVTQAHRVFEILDTPVQLAEPEDPIHLKPIRGKIEFREVTFGYHRHSPILRDLNVSIAPGEMLGVVGKSGSGKTTLVNLLCRFYDVDEGQVLIDDVDIRRIPVEELRSQIGVVLQEPFLFHGSIVENLRYGRPGASLEEIVQSSKLGNSHDFIMRQPHAYDTWIGERGAGLSGGERQRIGISRVLLTDPRILILDEATSSVDSESEAEIQSALSELIKDRTTIAIAHRLGTLRNSDKIVVVDQGKVVESGSHLELMMAGGQYFRLVRMQQPGLAEGMFREPPPLETKVHREEPSESPGIPSSKSYHTRWLAPKDTRIDQVSRKTLRVRVAGDKDYIGAFALRCFPVHFPNEYISLRFGLPNREEIEIGMVRNLDDWPPESRDLLLDSLSRRYFIHTIKEIHEIELMNNYLTFSTETVLGPRVFTMRWTSDRAPDYGPYGKMLLDIDDNRYVIRDLSELSEKERRLFERFIYW